MEVGPAGVHGAPAVKTCGTGYQDRHRSCTSPVPAYGGHSCAGSSNQQTSCLMKHCPGKYGICLRHTYFWSANNDFFHLFWLSRALSILVYLFAIVCETTT